MVHESISDRRAATRAGALAADLAADAADLLDVSASLGVEFRNVIAELLRAPEQPAQSVVRTLAALAPRAATGGHDGYRPPFVWVRIVPPGRRPTLTVRAGWLVPAAIQLIAEDAKAAGRSAAVHVIIPFDSGYAAAARVRAACAAIAPDVTVTIDVQSDERATTTDPMRRNGRWWRPSRRASGTRADERGFRGTWIVFGPVGATS
jgi:hypothetical protein